MIFYKNDYVIEKILNQSRSREQIFLNEVTGTAFSDREAKILTERISDHKWYVSEKLGRDIGFKVAAVDYLENIYESNNIRRQFNFDLRETLALIS